MEMTMSEAMNGFTEMTSADMITLDGGSWSWSKFGDWCGSGAIGGAVGGACTGASIGAAAGGVGAVPGGLIGAAGGFVGGAVIGGAAYCCFGWY